MSRVLQMWEGMTGTVLPYALATAPSGWLICDGSALASGTADVLRQKLIDDGSPYGTSGSDPLLPDLRGRVVAGVDNMGGSDAGRLTNAGTGNPGIDGDTLGAAGGSDRHALTDDEIGTVAQYATINEENGYKPAQNDAHPNAQPTIVLNYIVKT